MAELSLRTVDALAEELPGSLSWPRMPVPGAHPSAEAGLLAERMSWAGAGAKALWKPRLDRLRTIACRAELRLLETGEIRATVVTTDGGQLGSFFAAATARNLAAVPLAARRRRPSGAFADAADDLPLLCEILVTSNDDSLVTADLLARGDVAETACWFGWPECCARSWAEEFRNGAPDALALLLARGSASAPAGARVAAALGLGPLRHLPCSGDCAATAAAMERFVGAVHRCDVEAAAWLRQVAKWTASWNVVGGIAEVKTSHFRFEYLSAGRRGGAAADGSAAERRDSPAAASAPAENPAGAANNQERAAADGKPQRGPDVVAAGWSEAGFDSAFALRSHHCGLLWEWESRLRGGSGQVLHLPCADGLLLELIGEVNPRLRLVGVDHRPELLRAARRRRAAAAGDIRLSQWRPPDRPGLGDFEGGVGRAAFLDPEPLLALDVEWRRDLLRGLLAAFPLVIVYATDRALRLYGSLERLAAAAGVRLSPHPGCSSSAQIVEAA